MYPIEHIVYYKFLFRKFRFYFFKNNGILFHKSLILELLILQNQNLSLKCFATNMMQLNGYESSLHLLSNINNSFEFLDCFAGDTYNTYSSFVNI